MKTTLTFPLIFLAVLCTACTEIGIALDENFARPSREEQLRKLWIGRSEAELFERLGEPVMQNDNPKMRSEGYKSFWFRKSRRKSLLYEEGCDRMVHIFEGKVSAIYESGGTCKDFPFKDQDPTSD